MSTPKTEFIKLFTDNHHRIDFIHYTGGSGGEFLAKTIVENSKTDYFASTTTNCADSTSNRWHYEEPLKSFFLLLEKIARHTEKSYHTIEEVADEWDRCYSEHDKHKSIIEFKRVLSTHDRILFRTHGPFEGFNSIFPESKYISFAPFKNDWRYYTQMLALIKIILFRYDLSDANGIVKAGWFAEQNYTAAKAIRLDNIISKDIYDARVYSILSSGTQYLSAHSLIGLTEPESLGYAESYDESVDYILGIDSVEYNSDRYRTSIPVASRFTKYNTLAKYNEFYSITEFIDRFKIKQPLYFKRAIYGSLVCTSEISETNVIPELFNIDPIIYHKIMDDYKRTNLKAIEDILGITDVFE